MARIHVPERGDLVSLRFDPWSRDDETGRRPALVVSPCAYNRKVGLALICPVTSFIKGYPFEVPLPDDGEVRGAVLSDQMKSLDWRARRAEPLGRAPGEIVREVMARILALVDPGAGAPG